MLLTEERSNSGKRNLTKVILSTKNSTWTCMGTNPWKISGSWQAHIKGVYKHRVQSMNFEFGMPWGV
jgi:hypothetical protein